MCILKKGRALLYCFFVLKLVSKSWTEMQHWRGRSHHLIERPAHAFMALWESGAPWYPYRFRLRGLWPFWTEVPYLPVVWLASRLVSVLQVWGHPQGPSEDSVRIAIVTAWKWMDQDTEYRTTNAFAIVRQVQFNHMTLSKLVYIEILKFSSLQSFFCSKIQMNSFDDQLTGI